MKKVSVVFGAIAVILFTANCGAKKKMATPTPSVEAVKVMQYTYTKDIAPILQASCTPCHFPPDGRKEPLNSYATVKTHIGEVIERVKLAKDAKGFMPFMGKKPALTAAEITILETWKSGGMAE